MEGTVFGLIPLDVNQFVTQEGAFNNIDVPIAITLDEGTAGTDLIVRAIYTKTDGTEIILEDTVNARLTNNNPGGPPTPVQTIKITTQIANGQVKLQFVFEDVAAAQHILQTAGGVDHIILEETHANTKWKTAYFQAGNITLANPVNIASFTGHGNTDAAGGARNIGAAADIINTLFAFSPLISGELLGMGLDTGGGHQIDCFVSAYLEEFSKDNNAQILCTTIDGADLYAKVLINGFESTTTPVTSGDLIYADINSPDSINIHLENLGIQNCSGDKFGMNSSAVFVSHKNEVNATQKIHLEPSERMYVALNNANSLVLRQLDITIRDQDNKFITSLFGTSFLDFHVETDTKPQPFDLKELTRAINEAKLTDDILIQAANNKKF